MARQPIGTSARPETPPARTCTSRPTSAAAPCRPAGLARRARACGSTASRPARSAAAAAWSRRPEVDGRLRLVADPGGRHDGAQPERVVADPVAGLQRHHRAACRRCGSSAAGPSPPRRAPTRRWTPRAPSAPARRGSRRGTARAGSTAGPPTPSASRPGTGSRRCAGPGDADVGEPALLLELLGVARATRRCGKTPSSRPVRNTTGNSRPFAVCSVISVTTPSASASASGIWSASATSDDPLEEVRERRRSGVPACLGELAGHAPELLEVLDPRLVLRVVARRAARRGSRCWSSAASRITAGPVPASSSVRSRSSSDVKPSIAASERGAEADRLAGPAQRLGERDPLALGERLDARLGALADAAARGVEDPAQRDRVLGVGDRAQVGQRVA